MRSASICFLFLNLTAPAAIAQEFSYTNSRGEQVKLQPVAEQRSPGELAFALPGLTEPIRLGRGLLLRFEAGTSLLERSLLLAEHELQFKEAVGADGRLWLVESAGPAKTLQASSALFGQPGVEYALPDFQVPVQLCHAPSDPWYGEQWFLHGESTHHVNAEEAWDITMGLAKVVVAVIDTGVQTNHPDFNRARILPGYNSVTGEANADPGTGSIDAHGTACAGEIVAMMDNGEGGTGLCPGCGLMPIRYFDHNYSISATVRAFEHARTHGAWVASNSWHYLPETLDVLDIEPVRQAIRDLANLGREGKGAFVLFASANDYQEIPEQALANMPEVMAVGGTDYLDRRVDYSNWGPHLSVTAPTGSGWPGAMPGIFTCDLLGDDGMNRDGEFYFRGTFGDGPSGVMDLDETGNYTAYFNGTSAACPIAAGVVGLVFSAEPSLSASEARFIVEQTADKVGPLDEYNEDGHHDEYGYGRVNAGRAVRAAIAGFDMADGGLCAVDFNCASNHCLKAWPQDFHGLCRPSCDGESNCDSNASCEAGSCLPVCANHADCDAYQVCQGGGCLSLACDETSACPASSACMPEGDERICMAVCVSDEECQQLALCAPALGGDLCQRIPCLSDDPCPEGAACLPGDSFCKRPCLSDEECTAPALCLPAKGGDLCRDITCTADVACPEGTVCGDGHCIRPSDSGGCSTTGGAASTLSILSLLLGFAVRRTNR